MSQPPCVTWGTKGLGNLHMYDVHVPRLTHRTHVLLDEQRYQRLRARAAAEHTSVGALVRDAVDRVLDGDRDSEVASAEAFFCLLYTSPSPRD